MLMVTVLAAACGGHRQARTHPTDPFVTIQVAQLPLGTLSGAKVLLLTAGGVVVGDSAAPLVELESRRTALLAAGNAALDSALRRDGREVTWIGLGEQRSAARRNPTLELEPDRFATAYLAAPDADRVPDPLWGEVRSLAAVTGARFAVVPAGIKVAGAPGAYVASYIVVVADTRTGALLYRARATGLPAPTPEAALAAAAATVIATPLH